MKSTTGDHMLYSKSISLNKIVPSLSNVVNIPTPNMTITRSKNPYLGKTDDLILVATDNGFEDVTREELIKYISERDLIATNEAVRAMYDRFQVAVKLARSDDNGDTGD